MRAQLRTAGPLAVAGSYIYVAAYLNALAIPRTRARGDLNCDGAVDGGNIWPFFIALSGG